MRPAIVTHDTLELTEYPGLDCSNDPGETRQEDRDSTDLEKILKRGGVDTGWGRAQPVFGDTNYDWDLQTALAAADEAKRLINRLPQEVLAGYNSNEQLRLAALDGTLATQVKEHLDKEKRATELAKAQAANANNQGDTDESTQRNKSSRATQSSQEPEQPKRRRENRGAEEDR